MSDTHAHEPVDWKIHGVKVIPGDQLDTNTAQTPGMNRAAAINSPASARKRSGPARSQSTPTPRPARTITARSKA